MKESPHHVQAQNVPTATQFERLKQTGSTHRGLSLNRQARSEPEPVMSPFQFVHFRHNMSKAMWQLKATFAASLVFRLHCFHQMAQVVES